jgi:hypothetical protein
VGANSSCRNPSRLERLARQAGRAVDNQHQRPVVARRTVSLDFIAERLGSPRQSRAGQR